MGMLAQVVTQSTNTAQVFFLVALIIGIIATVVALLPAINPSPLRFWHALISATVTFISLGLLFFA
jgi:hypothetical protein